MSSNRKNHVVASRGKIKTEKMTDEFLESITTVLTELTPGNYATCLFLDK